VVVALGHIDPFVQSMETRTIFRITQAKPKQTITTISAKKKIIAGQYLADKSHYYRQTRKISP
jgi:hypothetical protein